MGFPPNFGNGDAEEDAILTLLCLRGITPRQLHKLAWDRGNAKGCVDEIASGRAGSQKDRSCLSDLDLLSIRRGLDACDARLALPGDAEYWPAFLRLDDPPVNFAQMAQTYSLYGEGPIETPEAIRPALERALRVVKDEGRLALVDIVMQPR